MKLYFAPGACSQAAHIALQEMKNFGFMFETEIVDLRTHQVKGQDYYKINPKGSVPALKLESDQILTEAAVILQYLADQKPEAHLMPAAGSLDRYRCQEWLNYIATEIHKGFTPFWNSEYPAQAKELAQKTLISKFGYINNHLQTRDFLMGSSFSVADAYLFPLVNWTRHFHINITQFSSLLGFMERVRNRPATISTLTAEGLLK